MVREVEACLWHRQWSRWVRRRCGGVHWAGAAQSEKPEQVEAPLRPPAHASVLCSCPALTPAHVNQDPCEILSLMAITRLDSFSMPLRRPSFLSVANLPTACACQQAGATSRRCICQAAVVRCKQKGEGARHEENFELGGDAGAVGDALGGDEARQRLRVLLHARSRQHHASAACKRIEQLLQHHSQSGICSDDECTARIQAFC